MATRKQVKTSHVGTGRPAFKMLDMKERESKQPKQISDAEWQNFLGWLGLGETVKTAQLYTGIHTVTLQAVLQKDFTKQEQYEQAKAIGRRSEWDDETLENIFDALANNLFDGTLKSVLAHYDRSYSKFSTLIRNDSDLREQYTIARQMQAEILMDQMRELAAGTDGEDIGRSRLKIDAVLKTIQVLDRERFGTRTTDTKAKQPLDGVDHARMMGSAQQRVEQMIESRKQKEQE